MSGTPSPTNSGDGKTGKILHENPFLLLPMETAKTSFIDQQRLLLLQLRLICRRDDPLSTSYTKRSLKDAWPDMFDHSSMVTHLRRLVHDRGSTETAAAELLLLLYDSGANGSEQALERLCARWRLRLPPCETSRSSALLSYAKCHLARYMRAGDRPREALTLLAPARLHPATMSVALPQLLEVLLHLRDFVRLARVLQEYPTTLQPSAVYLFTRSMLLIQSSALPTGCKESSSRTVAKKNAFVMGCRLLHCAVATHPHVAPLLLNMSSSSSLSLSSSSCPSPGTSLILRHRSESEAFAYTRVFSNYWKACPFALETLRAVVAHNRARASWSQQRPLRHTLILAACVFVALFLCVLLLDYLYHTSSTSPVMHHPDGDFGNISLSPLPTLRAPTAQGAAAASLADSHPSSSPVSASASDCPVVSPDLLFSFVEAKSIVISWRPVWSAPH